MPLIMDYVIDCNEQNEFEVKYKGEVIGKDRFHHNAVSMIMSNIAGRCERAEARVAELEGSDKDHLNSWTALMRELAKLSDALGLDDGDWSETDDSTLVEQFDPWTVIKYANNALQPLSAVVNSWNAYQETMDQSDVENKRHWTSFLEAMRGAKQVLCGTHVDKV